MFGYVYPVLQKLPEEEQLRFRSVYCGLCHTMGERFGFRSRFILNYDFTFLSILLSDKEEASCGHALCPAHPLHGRAYRLSDEALELAADESVILAYWQLQDGIADSGRLGGLKYRALASQLRGAYRKAAASRPEFDAVAREQLAILAQLEAEQCTSMDRAADAFAMLLSGAAAEISDPVRRRVLEQMLYHLGRWIYLIDAAHDLKEDAADGNYNPVALRYGLQNGEWTEESRAAFARTLDHSVHAMAAAFELWDFGCWRSILESTLYDGLFSVGKAVLDGTFRRCSGIGKEREECEDVT